MAQLKYCDKHNQVGFLRKPDESTGFAEIVDFLRGSNLRYALTANPPIYDSLVKQFWQSAITTSNTDGSLEIRATIDNIRYTISEASIRDSLQLDDATGITMLPNADLFEGMGQIGTRLVLWLHPNLLLITTYTNHQYHHLPNTNTTPIPTQHPPIPNTNNHHLSKHQYHTYSLDYITTHPPETEPTTDEHIYEEQSLSTSLSPSHRTRLQDTWPMDDFASSQFLNSRERRKPEGSRRKEKMILKILSSMTGYLLNKGKGDTEKKRGTKGKNVVSAWTFKKRLIDVVKGHYAIEVNNAGRKLILEETPKKSKEQILQEEASLAEAIRLDSLQKEEEAKQIHLDSLLAQRIAEEEELTEQQKPKESSMYNLRVVKEAMLGEVNSRRKILQKENGILWIKERSFLLEREPKLKGNMP
ncbi:hypothetical protein Tco_1540990 [Tanacetum coccineum]